MSPIDPSTFADLGQRLARAAGFRNLVAHAYADLDLRRVHATATTGPGDLRAFPAAVDGTLSDGS